MKKLLIPAVLIVFGVKSLYAQGELDEQQKVFFRNERSLGLLLNTDGLGASYRGAKRIDYRNKRLFEIDAGTLRHPKEYRQSSLWVQSTYIFGKLNSTFFLRSGLGRQHELFKKADLGGVAVRYFYSGGLAFAIYKPIYYKVRHFISFPNIYQDIEEKFDVSIATTQDIYSKASFTKGLNETKVIPGLYAKGGVNFEYSKEDKIIHAIEVGAQLNAFPKKIPIMAGSDNKSMLFSLFVSYRFGVILDPLDPEANNVSNIFRRKRNN